MPRKKEPTVEENMRNRFSLAKMGIVFAGEPSYRLEIGEEVVVGHLFRPKVKNILEDGKIYEIEFIKKDDFECDYFPWYEVRPKRNNTKSFLDTFSNVDFSLNYSQRNLAGIINTVYNFGVDFSPEYQRDFVWTNVDKVALIDSIFHGVDIGKFVFVKRRYVDETMPMYAILDGKQRLNACLEFFENKFAYRGKYFNDLCAVDANYFENYRISYAEMNNPTLEQEIRTFILLNTCGRAIDNVQIEKAKELYLNTTGSNFA